MRIGLLGPLGTFTEEATVKYCENESFEYDLVPYQTISEVFKAVQKGEVSEGVVPIENFLNGHVMETLDNLYNGELKVQSAIVIPIHHCFATTSSDGKIEIVKSHPQALAQCSNYLDENYPDAKRVSASSTADAMKELSEEESDNVAVIGSEVGAKNYGLNILEKDVGNEGDNKTMFFIIGKNESRKSDRNRTSLVIAPSVNKPGVLRGILNDFADESIDLKMIQSRPDGNGGYIFYIDVEGHIEDENVASVIDRIKYKFGDSGIKVLGSYPYASLSGV